MHWILFGYFVALFGIQMCDGNSIEKKTFVCWLMMIMGVSVLWKFKVFKGYEK